MPKVNGKQFPYTKVGIKAAGRVVPRGGQSLNAVLQKSGAKSPIFKMSEDMQKMRKKDPAGLLKTSESMRKMMEKGLAPGPKPGLEMKASKRAVKKEFSNLRPGLFK